MSTADASDAADASGAAGPGRAAGEPPVGTVAEEALKLVGALSGWSRAHEGHASGEDASGENGSGGDALGESGEPVAAPECAWCPLCRALRVLRVTDPEVREHLAAAGTSLVAAVAAALAPPAHMTRHEHEEDPG